MGLALATAVIEAATQFGPPVYEEIKAVINRHAAANNVPPPDWTKIDAQFQKDLAALKAAQSSQPAQAPSGE